MSIDSENASTPAAEAPTTKGSRKARKAKPTKKASRVKKPSAKPKIDRTNKKAIAMMKRAKGATLPEIVKGKRDFPGAAERTHCRGLYQTPIAA
jgi:hypothetical protein